MFHLKAILTSGSEFRLSQKLKFSLSFLYTLNAGKSLSYFFFSILISDF